MGGYLIMAVALLLSLFAMLYPGPQDAAQTSVSTARPTLQAVAANMLEVHRAAFEFVNKTQNRVPNPDDTLCGPNGGGGDGMGCWWGDIVSDLSLVTCSPGGVYDTAGMAVAPSCSSPQSDFQLGMIQKIYDWEFQFQCDYLAARADPYKYQCDGPGGTPDILITYSLSARVQGYTPQQVANALKSYPIRNDGWSIGICESTGTTYTDIFTSQTGIPVWSCVSGAVMLVTILR